MTQILQWNETCFSSNPAQTPPSGKAGSRPDLGRSRSVHVPAFLMVAQTVLPTRHLSFAAATLFVAAATLTCTLQTHAHVLKQISGLAKKKKSVLFSHSGWFDFSQGSGFCFRFLGSPVVVFVFVLVLTGGHQLCHADGRVQMGFSRGEPLLFGLFVGKKKRQEKVCI